MYFANVTEYVDPQMHKVASVRKILVGPGIYLASWLSCGPPRIPLQQSILATG